MTLLARSAAALLLAAGLAEAQQKEPKLPRWEQMDYGSPEFSPSDPSKKAHDEWTVTAAKLSEDRKTVSLESEGLRPVMQMRIQIRPHAADGTPLKLEMYSTVHRIPSDR